MNFVGRNAELETLEQAYGKDAFQMVVIYGRRRVGKTALIERFCQGKRALTFTARELSKSENLRDFSQAVYAFFGIPETAGSFANWNTCAIGVIPEDKLVQNTKPIISMFAYLSPFFSHNTL